MSVERNQPIKKIFRLKAFHTPRGQGLIETALLFPVLLVVLSGMVEFGFLLNEYLALQDAARNAARFAADSQYDSDDATPDYSCSTTRNFYRQTACLVNVELAQERPEISLNLGNGEDDVVLSVFSITAGTAISPKVDKRFPTAFGEAGWSLALDTPGWASRNQSSEMTSGDVQARLNSAAPNTGLILVEIYYSYQHKLGLPWITAFVHNPTMLRAYAIMPLSSAEPTPTPLPDP